MYIKVHKQSSPCKEPPPPPSPLPLGVYIGMCQAAALCTSSSSPLILHYSLHHRVHTERQQPISGVHSIMMEKLAQASEGGGARPSPFTIQ
jgi:hypothetical protein